MFKKLVAADFVTFSRFDIFRIGILSSTRVLNKTDVGHTFLLLGVRDTEFVRSG